MKVYRVRNNTSGLFYKGTRYGKPVWAKQGRLYTNLGHLKNSIKCMDAAEKEKDVDISLLIHDLELLNQEGQPLDNY